MVARELKFPVWMTIKAGAEENIAPGVIPAVVEDTEDLFTTMIGLKTVGKEIDVYLLKGGDANMASSLAVDPSTLLIKNRE